MKGRLARHARLPARLLSSGLLIGGLGVPVVAHAQTISQSLGQPYPARLINGAVQNVRPENLNPRGISYADCASDMVLQYNVLLSSFLDQTVEVWVSTSGDCTQNMNRGNAGVANCWLVARTQPQRATTTVPLQLNVPVRAIVGPQAQTTFSAGLVTDMGISACNTQTTSAAVQFTVFFLPIASPSNYVGTGLMQAITADTVGPPAPAINGPSVGDTFVAASWTPNGDPDTVGYDVFVERVSSTAAVTTSDASTIVCRDSGSSTPGDAGQDADDGASGSTDAATLGDADDSSSSSTDATTGADADDGASSPTDAATAADNGLQASSCINVAPASTPISAACVSTALSSAIASDSGVTTSDDAGNVVAGPGGVATIDCQFLIGGNCSSGQPAYTSTSVTVSGQANSSFNIKSLTDGVTYNYTVAAVDGFGNIGPPATVECASPAKVNDFFTIYRESGGRGGGGFCALDVVGEHSETSLGLAGLGLGAALVARRRRSRRS